MGKAAKEVPRWKRKKQQQPAATVIQLRGRQARRFTREVAAIPAQARGKEGKEGTATANDVLAHSGAWRFRKHLVPFAWLAGLAAASGLRAAPHPLLWGLAASAAVPALMILFTRHLPEWTRRAVGVAALVTSAWLPVLAAVPLRSCAAWLLLTWAPLAALWVRRYRWRPLPPEPAAGLDDDAATWAALAEQEVERAPRGARRDRWRRPHVPGAVRRHQDHDGRDPGRAAQRGRGLAPADDRVLRRARPAGRRRRAGH